MASTVAGVVVDDGQDEGGLAEVWPVDGLQAERGGQPLAQVVRGFGEQPGRVGQLVDEGQVTSGSGATT
jgi:hypothetical protein